MDTTAPASNSAAWSPAGDDATPVVRLLDARVLRTPGMAYPLSEGHHPYICSDIKIDIELCGIALPPLVLTVCSSNVLSRAPITQSTWPVLEWIYWGEGSEFFDALRCSGGDYVIEREDLREAVLDVAQGHPLVRRTFREVGRLIEQVLKDGAPA